MDIKEPLILNENDIPERAGALEVYDTIDMLTRHLEDGYVDVPHLLFDSAGQVLKLTTRPCPTRPQFLMVWPVATGDYRPDLLRTLLNQYREDLFPEVPADADLATLISHIPHYQEPEPGNPLWQLLRGLFNGLFGRGR